MTATPGEHDNEPPTCDICGTPPCDPGCTCSGWNGDTGAHRECEAAAIRYDERRATYREEAYQRARQDDAPPAFLGVEL